LLPAAAFIPHRIGAPEPVCLSYLLEATASERPFPCFRSPATTVLFRKPPRRGQSSWPIPSASIPNLSSSPFGPELPPSAPFFTSPGAFLAQNPLPAGKPETLKRPSNFRSPSGLSSLRISALGQRLNLRSLPLCSTRFSFAPRWRQSLLITTRHRIIVPDSLPFTRLSAL
jgi:hypothetical protein